MIPNLDFIRTMLEGIRESVFAGIKRSAAELGHRISEVDAKIQPPDYAAGQGAPGYILNKPELVGRPGTVDGAEIFNRYDANAAEGIYAHAEGTDTTASGNFGGHAEGCHTTASGSFGSHAEGHEAVASGMASHAEGQGTIAASDYQHVQGAYNVEDAEGRYSHIVGNGNISHNDAGKLEEHRSNAHTLDWDGNAWFAGNVFVGGSSQDDAAAELLLTRGEAGKLYAPVDAPAFTGSVSMGRKAGTAVGGNSTAMGRNTAAAGAYAHAEGDYTSASGDGSHTEGYGTAASGAYAHAEGRDTTATEQASHAEGMGTVAGGNCAHAEGRDTVADGTCSHAEGQGTKAMESWAHAEGYGTEASGSIAHAEGDLCVASGMASHAEGQGTIAASDYQHVQGAYNVEDAEYRYLHIVGNGKLGQNDAGEPVELRSNAHTLDWYGNAWFAGTVEGQALILRSAGGKVFRLSVSDAGELQIVELLR